MAVQSISQMARSGRFSLPLHGLRGIAVLFVLFSHLGNADMWLLPIPHDAIGKVGVWIFFALSSFLLTRGLCAALSRQDSWGWPLLSYAIHRVLRIYPLYVLVLIAHWLLGDISAASVFRHLMLQEGVAELWAIPVEFKYYLVVPLVALAAQHVPLRWVSACLLAGVLASFADGQAHVRAVFSIELALLPKLAPFLLGSLLALHADRLLAMRADARGQLRWLASLCSPLGQGLLWGFFVVVAVLFRAMIKGHVSHQWAALLGGLIALSAVGLILVSLHQTWTASLLRNRLLVFFGEISFSLYLLHMFFVHAMEAWGRSLPAMLQAWLVMAVCIPAAFLSWRFIERPGIQAGKCLDDKLQTRAGRRCYS